MNDILDIPLSETRRSFTQQCPICSADRRKQTARSLSVYRDDDGWIRYICHHPGCAWNTWQKRKDDLPPPTRRAEDLAIIMPIPNRELIPKDYFGDFLYWYRNKDGQPLFANRRIQIGSTKVYVPFVYTSEGFVTGKKAKWPVDFKGLFGMETLKGKDKVVIVEGEKAALAAQAMFPNYAVVTWLGGANRGYDKADWSVLKSITTAILWPDNDEPGIEVMNKIAPTLPCKNIFIANVSNLPEKHDLADPIATEDISKALRTSKRIATKINGVCSMEDILGQIKESHRFRKSGYTIFDAHTKLPGSGLLVIEGRTKHYKTSLAIALTANMIQKELESRVLFYSYEMKASKVFLRYIRTFSVEANEDNYINTDGFKIVSKWIENESLQIVDQAAQLTIKDIVQAASKFEMNGGIIVVDYIQIVPVTGSFNKNTRQIIIKELLDELRVVAHKNNILVIVLSQLTPDYANPHNDSPREAKDIHFSADVVLRVWNKDLGEHHPTFNSIPKNFIIHTYLNREGESNVIFESTMEEGAKLDIKRRVKK